jgi:aspartate aminotransferase-like enzyme
LGFSLVAAPEHRSATVTAAWLPDGLDWGEFGSALRSRGLVLAGGQGKWTGRILRIGHMGDVAWGEIDAALTVMGETLEALGRPADPAAARDAGRATYDALAGVAAI